MREPLSVWVGRDEAEGIPVPDRVDLAPPPHWRLDAIAATERPRSLDLGADRRRLAFIQDRDTSDVWLLDLAGGVPERLTTRREPAPYWEDVTPRLSPDGTQVAYGDEGELRLVPTAGGPPRTLLEAGEPAWLDDARLVVAVERERTTRLAVVDVADRGRAGWRPGTAGWRRTATRGRPRPRRTCARSPTRSRRATTSTAARSASPTSKT